MIGSLNRSMLSFDLYDNNETDRMQIWAVSSKALGY